MVIDNRITTMYPLQSLINMIITNVFQFNFCFLSSSSSLNFWQVGQETVQTLVWRMVADKTQEMQRNQVSLLNNWAKQ